MRLLRELFINDVSSVVRKSQAMRLLVLLAVLPLSGCVTWIADCEPGRTEPVTNPPCYRIVRNGTTGQTAHQIVVQDAGGFFHMQEVEP